LILWGIPHRGEYSLIDEGDGITFFGKGNEKVWGAKFQRTTFSQ